MELNQEHFLAKVQQVQLKYSIREQELFKANKACKHFHPIIYWCDIIIRCDHINITHEETQHANLRVLWQLIALDQVYQAKLEHIAGASNTGTDGHSRLHMRDLIPDTLVQKFYAINELECTNNLDFPLSIEKIREERDLTRNSRASSNQRPNTSR